MMEWGVYGNPNTLKFSFGDEKWFHREMAFDRTIDGVTGTCLIQGPIFWQVDEGFVKRHNLTSTTYEIDPTPTTHIAISDHDLYICKNRELWKVGSCLEKVRDFPIRPIRILGSEAGILYETSTGIYTPHDKFLARDISIHDAHEGIFAGVTHHSIKIWYVSSWQMHHRISVPGNILDMSVTKPWVCAITDKHACCVWNVHTGEAHRQWCVEHGIAVAIDSRANVIVCGQEQIAFYEDTSTCVYALKESIDDVLSCNDTMWVRKEQTWSRTRPVQLWPIHLAEWCETPLSVPFPHPPRFTCLSETVILERLEPFWKPRSFATMCKESCPYTLAFSQLVDMESWAREFFSYARERTWTPVQTQRALKHLRSMNIPIDVITWANVDERPLDDHTIALWDAIVDGSLDERHVTMIRRVCDAKRDDWMLERAEMAASLVAHPFLLSFLHLDTCMMNLDTLWDEWVPIVMKWMRTARTYHSGVFWRIFLSHFVLHGPESYNCTALEIMNETSTCHPVRPHLEHEVCMHAKELAAHPRVLFQMAEPALRIFHKWDLACASPMLICMATHDHMFVWTSTSLLVRDMTMARLTIRDAPVPISIAKWEDQVAVVLEDSINIHKQEYKHTFEMQVIDVEYEDAYRLWTLSEHGVLKCIHSVHGRLIYEETMCFPYAHTLICIYPTMYIICSESVCVYNVREHIFERNLMLSHVMNVFHLQETAIFVFEDNTFCLEQTCTPLYTSSFRPVYVREHDEHVVLVTSVEFKILDRQWHQKDVIMFTSPVVDVCRVNSVWYILHASGEVSAVEWKRQRVQMIQEACMHMDEHVLQREAHRIVDIFMLDTSLCGDTVYMDTIQRMMKDRAVWECLLREDVLEWFMEIFFRSPKIVWSPLWRLFSYRGTVHQCAICQCSTVSKDHPVVILKNCAHRFHESCITRMIELHESRNRDLREEYALTADLTCPVCRAPYKGHVIDREYTELATYESE